MKHIRSRHSHTVMGLVMLAFTAVGCSQSNTASVGDGPSNGQAVSNSWLDSGKGLETVPPEFRPKFRWWWPTDELNDSQLVFELDTMHRAGFGGVEIVLLTNYDRFGTTEFRSRLRTVLKHANQLGMKVDLTLGPAWPMSSASANVTSDELSSRDIVYGWIDLILPLPYIGIVPRPIDSGLLHQRLVAVTAAKLVPSINPGIPLTFPDSLALVPVGGGSGPALPENPLPVRLDPDSMVDISGSVGSSGLLQWTPPSVGRWRIFAFWSRATAQRPHDTVLSSFFPATLQANIPIDIGSLLYGDRVGPLVIDHFNKEATRAALDEFDSQLFDEEMQALFRQNGGHTFEDSYELHHNQLISTAVSDNCVFCYARFWTRDFLEEFKRRRGYDISPFLPVIYSAYDLSDDNGSRIRKDFFRTLSDLLIDDHIKPIAEWADDHGLRARSQTYHLKGVPISRASSHAALPDTESLAFGDTGSAIAVGSEASFNIIDQHRRIVSGAHISGADEISIESGAKLFSAYSMTPEDYKSIADRAFAAGVTTQVIHGYAYKPYVSPTAPHSVWPGWDAWESFFSESWNDEYPQMAHWPSLAGYFGRASAILRQGKPNVDLLVLKEEDESRSDLRSALQRAGYSWDVVVDDTLESVRPPISNRLSPEGPAYQVLVIDRVSTLSGESSERLLSWARAGLPMVLIGDSPAKGASFKDVAAEDAMVQRSISDLLALPNVRRIGRTQELPAQLKALGIEPSIEAANFPGLVFQRRRTDDWDLWLIYNNDSKVFDGEVRLASKGAPQQLDLWTGFRADIPVFQSLAKAHHCK